MMKHRTRKVRIIGCSTASPLAGAIAPTINGIMDAPEALTAEQTPTAGTRILAGSRLDSHGITQGKIGPKTNPRAEELASVPEVVEHDSLPRNAAKIAEAIKFWD
jgi:hypothetical protein